MPPNTHKSIEEIEKLRDWIETNLDAEAHGTWYRAPNFDIIQDVAGFVAPLMYKYAQQQVQEAVSKELDNLKAELRKEIEGMKRGKDVLDDKEWAIHYRGHDEALNVILSSPLLK